MVSGGSGTTDEGATLPEAAAVANGPKLQAAVLASRAMRLWIGLVVAVLILAFSGVVATGGLGDGGEEGPPNATVAEFRPTVVVTEGTPESGAGEDGVTKCLHVGPGPGNYAIAGGIVLERPLAGEDSGPTQFRSEVWLANGTGRWTRNVTLDRGESSALTITHVAPDTGAVTAGESATVHLRVTNDERRVAAANRTVTADAGGCVQSAVALATRLTPPSDRPRARG